MNPNTVRKIHCHQLYPEPITLSDIRRIRSLSGQLSGKRVSMSRGDVVKVTTNSVVIVARLTNGLIVGMVTLTQECKFSGMTGYMHDLVVDAAYRRQGIAQGLIEKLKWWAKSSGLKRVRFTSKPARVAANLLYVSLGATTVETNVYEFEFREDHQVT